MLIFKHSNFTFKQNKNCNSKKNNKKAGTFARTDRKKMRKNLFDYQTMTIELDHR